MLGETFEAVLPNCRFIAEAVSLDPVKVDALCFEGEHFNMLLTNSPSPKFALDFGRGKLTVHDNYGFYITHKKFDESITFNKAKPTVKNIIAGTMYIDMDGL